MINKSLCFQDVIFTLQKFWGDYGCIILQPYDMEMGAGTFHPATTLKSLGPDPWNCCYVQPSRRPTDGRYGENPNRLQHYYQMQVILKPSPDNIQELYLESLRAVGLSGADNDIRFVEDDWESPTLGASGLGWEVWCNGLEITQFTYFQQVGGFECNPVSGEITYGLERLTQCVQGTETFFDMAWNAPTSQYPMTYGDIARRIEQEFSAYNFEQADTDFLFSSFAQFEKECAKLIAANLALPAYEQCIKASHVFNLMDARGVISVTQRAGYIGRVRNLAKMCCKTFVEHSGKAVK